jgi:hypothetical protein
VPSRAAVFIDAMRALSVLAMAAAAACVTLVGRRLAGARAGLVRWRRDRDTRLLWSVPAVVAGLAACVPLAITSQA